MLFASHYVVIGFTTCVMRLYQISGRNNCLEFRTHRFCTCIV